MSSSKYPPRRTAPDLVWFRGLGRKSVVRFKGWRSEPSTSELCFFAPHFYRHDTPEPWIHGVREEWPADGNFESSPKVESMEDPDRDSFFATHSEILSGIEENRFQKVVPFAAQKFEFSEELSWTHFPAAFADPAEQFAFGFQIQNEGLCGITPELLFHVRGDLLVTSALAGTGRLGGPGLLDDRKERLEHDLVIEHILAALRDLGDIAVDQTQERNFPAIKHLYTPIVVRLREAPNFADLVNRLHPTAALGGLPRAAAMDFLRLRGGERWRFGAPFGYASPDEMVCVVAIRALQWRGAEAWLMSGCGVVKGSKAEREWLELTLKRESTARQLGLEL